MPAASIFLAMLFSCLPAMGAKAPAPSLPDGLANFLGAPPPRFEEKFRRPARDLKAAHEYLVGKKIPQALKKLQGLVKSELGEHAGFELANLFREKKEFSKSTEQAEKLLHSFPGTVYADRMRDLIDKNECSLGLTAKGQEAIRLLERCLWRTHWKGWQELEPQALALYQQLKTAKDPLLEPFISELIQAMPASSELRRKIAAEVPNDKLEELASLARFRGNSSSSAGVKSVYPDIELFDSGMKLVLQQKWSDANAIFKRFSTEFPQSENADRAEFWIARTEDKLGNAAEAEKRFKQILSDNPFTYYGLQAALYLKHDWAPVMNNPLPPLEGKWQGALLSRQALSLWRLRALLEAGLLDYAREEAKFLAQSKGHGAGIGQDDAKGALLMATLFHDAGNHMAAFSHAYAGLSMDPSLLNKNSALLIFPQAFSEDFAAAAEQTGVNTLLLASVAKQESAFLPNAVSRADALGLMQLLPITAKEVIPNCSRAELFQPAMNAKAGALYLNKLLERFQGNIALALAGYNAGPNRAAQWQKEFAETPLLKSGFDPDAFIDTIPFAETRKYVGNILRNYAWYKLLAEDGKLENVEELNFQWQKSPKNQEPSAKKPLRPTPNPLAT